MTISIDHSVPMIPKQTQTDCWLASTKMLLGGAHVSVSTEGARLASGGGLLMGEDNLRAFAGANNLKIYMPHWEAAAYELRKVIHKGPAMLVIDYGEDRGGHAIVICGIEITGSNVHMLDPDPPGLGTNRWLSWPMLARRIHNMTFAIFTR